MRGEGQQQGALVNWVLPEQRLTADHALRLIRRPFSLGPQSILEPGDDPGGSTAVQKVCNATNGDVPPRWMIGGPKSALKKPRSEVPGPKPKELMVSDIRLHTVLVYYLPEMF